MVAPIHCNSPLDKAGFIKLLASIAPSADPAPTTVCNSSMNKITLPSELLISSITAFNLSSNSPLNLLPAIKAPISKANIFLFLKIRGTSFLTIFCAKASAIAVFPTPGPPINTGLFLLLLINV